MDKNYLLTLLQKYNRGEATPEEARLLEKYYDLFESAPGGLEMTSEEESALLKDSMYGVISQKMADGSTGKLRLSGKPLAALAIAASLLVVCITIAFYSYTHSAKSQQALAVAGGQKENRLVYLPDGSKVIISAGSKFYRSPSFGTGKREVYLEGQAYFDIAHDSARPFVVHTGKLETAVLGTAFTIKALPGEEQITITVIRGRVRVSNRQKILGLLTPGRQITFFKKADSAVQQPATEPGRPDWKEQDLLVNDVTVQEAAKLLEERFSVHITIEDTLIANNRFTTVFLKTESLEQILKSICEFNGVTYRYNREKAVVHMYKNTPN